MGTTRLYLIMIVFLMIDYSITFSSLLYSSLCFHSVCYLLSHLCYRFLSLLPQNCISECQYTYSSADMDARSVMEQRLQSMVTALTPPCHFIFHCEPCHFFFSYPTLISTLPQPHTHIDPTLRYPHIYPPQPHTHITPYNTKSTTILP